jgi:hypothetical protein
MNKCQSILKEFSFNLIFLWILFMLCYSNKSQDAFNYQNQQEISFSGYETVKYDLFFNFPSEAKK